MAVLISCDFLLDIAANIKYRTCVETPLTPGPVDGKFNQCLLFIIVAFQLSLFIKFFVNTSKVMFIINKYIF